MRIWHRRRILHHKTPADIDTHAAAVACHRLLMRKHARDRGVQCAMDYRLSARRASCCQPSKFWTLACLQDWQSMLRSRPGADVAAIDIELAAMRRDLELLQQYAEQDVVHVDGVTIAAQ